MRENSTYRELLEEFLPDRSSPLYQVTAEYAFSAVERGLLIADIIEKHTAVQGSRVVDLGSGEGGVSIAFALRGAETTALDAEPDRIDRMNVWASEHNVYVNGMVADAMETGLPDGQFDIVICNDLMEHVRQPQKLAYEINRLLKEGGIAYLSVPNKLSIFGFLRDSHLGLTGIIWMPRWLARIYAERIRRRTKYYTVFVVPTHRYLKKIFREAGIELTPVFTESPSEKIINPHLMNPSPKRKMLMIMRKLGLTGIALRFLNSEFKQLFLDTLTYVGHKKESQ